MADIFLPGFLWSHPLPLVPFPGVKYVCSDAPADITAVHLWNSLRPVRRQVYTLSTALESRLSVSRGSYQPATGWFVEIFAQGQHL